MKIDLRNRIGGIRSILIWSSVLAALLFSCGEGIRLFPFPAAQLANAATLESDAADRPSYLEYVHCIEKRPGSNQTRSERDDRPHHGMLQNMAPDGALVVVSALSQKTEHSLWSGLGESRLWAAWLSGRAPPLS